jgi:hypothetical protein
MSRHVSHVQSRQLGYVLSRPVLSSRGSPVKFCCVRESLVLSSHALSSRVAAAKSRHVT